MNKNNRIEEINIFLESNIKNLQNRIIEICSIPSPTGHEERKAEFIKSKLLEIGAKDAYIDEVGNVIYLYNPGMHEKIVVFCAHIDTVFNDIESILPKIKDNRIYAPSVADNSSNVGGLLLIISMLLNLEIIPKIGILFTFNVGEEALGNLKGIRCIVDRWQDSIEEVVAVDGSCNSIVNVAVGSRRYMVHINTSGGRSWKDFGEKNAILYASKIIDRLYKVDLPTFPKTTYNVGLIKGGTSINAIAGEVEFLVELRSESVEYLNKLYKDFREIVNQIVEEDVKIDVKLLGERPCGKINFQTELEKRVIRIRRDLGMDSRFCSASTDCNIPLSRGIPAISFGIRKGKGNHTIHEYVELDSLEKGIKLLANFILSYC